MNPIVAIAASSTQALSGRRLLPWALGAALWAAGGVGVAGGGELSGGDLLVPWLGGGLLAMSLLAGGLARRVLRLQAELRRRTLPVSGTSCAETAADASDADVAALPSASPAPVAEAALAVVAVVAVVADLAIAADEADGPEVVPAAPLSADTLQVVSPVRAVTVDALIDVERQAEFFVALGQDDAAIDLLLEHIRASGGACPLPYLKLLEIYRHQGDAMRYERVRARFTLRFNGVAPAWSGSLEQGDALEAYAAVIAELQSLWHSPAAALDRLETLLLRGRESAPFDLPAFRDILLLRAVAQELRDSGAPVAADAQRSVADPPSRPMMTLDVDLDLLAAQACDITQPFAYGDFRIDGDRLALEAALSGRLMLPPTQQRH